MGVEEGVQGGRPLGDVRGLCVTVRSRRPHVQVVDLTGHVGSQPARDATVSRGVKHEPLGRDADSLRLKDARTVGFRWAWRREYTVCRWRPPRTIVTGVVGEPHHRYDVVGRASGERLRGRPACQVPGDDLLGTAAGVIGVGPLGPPRFGRHPDPPQFPALVDPADHRRAVDQLGPPVRQMLGLHVDADVAVRLAVAADDGDVITARAPVERDHEDLGTGREVLCPRPLLDAAGSVRPLVQDVRHDGPDRLLALSLGRWRQGFGDHRLDGGCDRRGRTA